MYVCTLLVDHDVGGTTDLMYSISSLVSSNVIRHWLSVFVAMKASICRTGRFIRYIEL